MGDTTDLQPKKDKDHIWVYVTFVLVWVLYLNFSDEIWNDNNNIRARNNYRTNATVRTNNNTSANNNSRTSTDYCSLSSSEVFNYLTNERSFTLNGNGYVQFTKRNDYSRNKWVEGKFVVSSSGYRLEGDLLRPKHFQNIVSHLREV